MSRASQNPTSLVRGANLECRGLTPHSRSKRRDSVTRLPDTNHPREAPLRSLCLAERGPLFSIAYTLFSIRNLAHSFCFEAVGNSLQKTPGGGHPIILRVSFAFVTPIESDSFTTFPCKSFRILLFHKWGVGYPPRSPKSPFTVFSFLPRGSLASFMG